MIALIDFNMGSGLSALLAALTAFLQLVTTAGVDVPEPGGPDDVGSPVLAVLLFLLFLGLVCVGLWLALLGVAAVGGFILLATGVVSAAAAAATWRGRTWTARGLVLLRTASGAGGLLSGLALGEVAHLVVPQHVSQRLGLAGGAAAGLGAGLLLAGLLHWLAQALGRWLEARRHQKPAHPAPNQ